jgi:hypothetical protein
MVFHLNEIFNIFQMKQEQEKAISFFKLYFRNFNLSLTCL